MQTLQHSPNGASLPAVLPSLHLLRRQDHSALGYPTHRPDCYPGPAPRKLGSVGRVRTQRANHSPNGQGKGVVHWPGQRYGIRGPLQDETPLSWEEIELTLRMGVML